jgi:hypothetical protein
MPSLGWSITVSSPVTKRTSGPSEDGSHVRKQAAIHSVKQCAGQPRPSKGAKYVACDAAMVHEISQLSMDYAEVLNRSVSVIESSGLDRFYMYYNYL